MLIATDNAVYQMSDGHPYPIYENGPVRAIARAGSRDLIAIVSDEGLTVHQGDTVTRNEMPDTNRVEAVDILDDGQMLVGTEGPHIYRFSDGAIERIESFAKMKSREDFYTPWGGPASVRSLAHTREGWVYADIHVGSIMRSRDRGHTWEPVTPDLHEDVHQVVTLPSEPNTVYANTADAVYVSEDRGSSWEHRDGGLPYSYGRAIAVHPDDGDCLLATVSRGPHANVDGRLYRSDDRGRSWSHVTAGFPASTEQNIDTFQIEFTQDGRGWAAADRDLFVSEDRGQTWKVVWSAPDPVRQIAG